MKKPKPLRPDQLIHKSDVVGRSPWNGDKRRSAADGSQGFNARRQHQGLTVTEGTAPPSKSRPAVGRPGMPIAPPGGCVGGIHHVDDLELSKTVQRPAEPFDLAEMTAHQVKMLSNKPKKKQ